MNEELFEKLQAEAESSSLDNDAKSDELIRFERSVGHALPKSYAEVLVRFGGSVSFGRSVRYRPKVMSPWAREDKSQSCESLFGLEGKRNIFNQMNTYSGRLPSGTIPIGDAPGGNLVAMDLNTGHIYFWDHEKERTITGQSKNDFANMYLIATSFSKFLGLLHAAAEEPLEGGDVNVWLSDDL